MATRRDPPTDFQSGFGESKLTAFNTLFHEGNVWVSDEQFVNSGKHYPIEQIKAASVVKGSPITPKSIGVLLAGLATIPFQQYVGLAIFAATVFFWIGRKPYFVLTLNIRGKQVKAMQSTDRKYLNTIYDAIVQSIEAKRYSK